MLNKGLLIAGAVFATSAFNLPASANEVDDAGTEAITQQTEQSRITPDAAAFVNAACILRDYRPLTDDRTGDFIVVIDKNDASDSDQSQLSIIDVSGEKCSVVFTTPIVYGTGGDYAPRNESEEVRALRTQFLDESEEGEIYRMTPAGDNFELILREGSWLNGSYYGGRVISIADTAPYVNGDGELQRDDIAIHSWLGEPGRVNFVLDGDPSNDARTYGCIDVPIQDDFDHIYETYFLPLAGDWTTNPHDGTRSTTVFTNVFVLPVTDDSLENALAMNGYDVNSVIELYDGWGLDFPSS